MSLNELRTFVTISTSALKHNITMLAALLHPSNVALMVKNNAYGHGMELIASCAEQIDAVKILCTATRDEALTLKRGGCKKPLLVLSSVTVDLDDAIKNEIAVVLAERYLFDAVYVGINAYGLWSSQESRKRAEAKMQTITLKPIATWKTRIIQIKQVPQESFVGYNKTFKTLRSTLLAVLPVGYWDGYPRALSNNSFVMVKGIAAPIRGIISMNLMTIEITDIPDVTVGDEVILLGADHMVHASTIAQNAGALINEITTRINPLIPRIPVP